MKAQQKKISDAAIKLKGVLASIAAVSTYTVNGGLSGVVRNCNSGECSPDDLIYEANRVSEARKDILAYVGLAAQLPKALKVFSAAIEDYKIALETAEIENYSNSELHS